MKWQRSSASNISKVNSLLTVSAAVATIVTILSFQQQRRRRRRQKKKDGDKTDATSPIITTASNNNNDNNNNRTTLSAYEKLIGNTPLIKLEKLSMLIGRSIYVKMECMNPGGTGKDRPALYMIQHGEELGQLPPPTTTTTTTTSASRNHHNENNNDEQHQEQDEHNKRLDWYGWEETDDDRGRRRTFALEMQEPWSEYLISGRKTIEVRSYKLPKALLGKRIDILQSPKGQDGISALGNYIDIDINNNNNIKSSSNDDDDTNNKGKEDSNSSITSSLQAKQSPGSVKRIGWCKIGRIIQYNNKESFESDEDKHLVERGSGYSWKVGSTKVLYGWVVDECGAYDDYYLKQEAPLFYQFNKAVRRMRSLFELQNQQESINNNNSNKIDGQIQKINHKKVEKKVTPTTQKYIHIIKEAMNFSSTGGLVIEGTSGSTGISLATICNGKGHGCLVVMPDDQSQTKVDTLRTLGAYVYVVKNVSISNPNHYVNIANQLTKIAVNELNIKAIFINQFENPLNYKIHYKTTGPEIYKQLQELQQTNNNYAKKSNSIIDAFVMSSGTGGTISGVGTYLKEKNKSTRIVLVDPPGSVLHNKIKCGVAYTSEQSERTIKRHRYDTIAEGIGLDRLTENFNLGLKNIDESIKVTDQEAIDMAHYLLEIESLFVGSSSSMNIVGAIRTALSLPPKSVIVTIVCDSGTRHLTRFWNEQFITDQGFVWPKLSSSSTDSGSNGKNMSKVQQRIPDCLSSVI